MTWSESLYSQNSRDLQQRILREFHFDYETELMP